MQLQLRKLSYRLLSRRPITSNQNPRSSRELEFVLGTKLFYDYHFVRGDDRNASYLVEFHYFFYLGVFGVK